MTAARCEVRRGPKWVMLWDAINEYAAVTGGNTSITSVARQQAVVEVERAIDSILVAVCAQAHAMPGYKP